MPATERPPAGADKLRICFVCDELPPAPGGGIGSFVRTLGRRLKAEGHEVHVVGHYSRRHDWPADGPEVHPILPAEDALRGAPLGGRRALRERLRRLREQAGLDVVEWPSYQGPFLRRVPGTVDVVRLHSPVPRRPDRLVSPRSWFMQWMRVRTLRAVPNWVAVSRWVLEDSLAWTRAKPARWTVIPNPVDCELFRPAEGGARERLVAFVGSLTEIKGAFTLARVLRRLLPEHPGWRAIFAGRDPEGTGAARLRAELGDEALGRTDISGALPAVKVAKLMRRGSIVAAPGDLETFGMVWAEAMASGAALIASTTAAGPEVVPAEAGLHVPPGDERALAEALQRLMAAPDLCRALGRHGRAWAMERFTVDKVAEQSLAFYRQCLAAAGGQGGGRRQA